MIVNIIFYEDPEPEDCNIFGVYHYKRDAKQWLESRGWYFDTDYCVWYNSAYRGFVEILEKELF